MVNVAVTVHGYQQTLEVVKLEDRDTDLQIIPPILV